MHYNNSIPLIDLTGKDTLWETVYYDDYYPRGIPQALIEIYSLLKTDGDIDAHEHLSVDRIDYCSFGNTHPFRVRIINRLNDNYDHYYIKRTDSSRVYGLELEHLLSPDRVRYMIDGGTIVEEHIVGLPGDFFLQERLEDSEFNQIRMAKEFVKFNERCFVRLLGDMRSYNYVVDITPDIEATQYRIRAIDFDQQSYEGRKNFYLPQYFSDNNPIINLGIKHMDPKTVRQYQLEERILIKNRIVLSMDRLTALIGHMRIDRISSHEKTEQLRNELAVHHENDAFLSCESMGDVVLANIELLLQKKFKQSIVFAKGT